MNASFQKTLCDVVLLLNELPRQRSSVESAHARFKRFENAHRGVRCDLLVDQPPGSNEADYDILLGAPDGGTVAVSWRPDEGVPWTVQYSDHWAANYVLTVNKHHSSIQSALIYLRTVLNRKPDLMNDLINKLLIQEAMDESPPAVSNKETEKAVDEFRLSHGLYSAVAMRQWLDEMSLTMAALRELASGNVSAHKLKKRVTADKVRPYFDAHRNDFEVLTIFRVQVPSKTIAAALTKAGRRSGLWATIQKKRSWLTTPNGQLATMFSRELPPAFASASPGTIIGPERSPEGYWVGQLLQHRGASFDDRTRARIEDLVFEDWLAERRKQATVRWHWV
jgi:putative peptide maturation system protein